jgi:hypothetical protein
MKTLSDVLRELSQLHLQVKLFVGYGDAINGYGWHTVYFVDVVETIEFCSKCRRNKGVNYLDDYYPNHHQHQHSFELKSIFTGTFMNNEDLVKGLETLLNSRKTAE